MKPYKLMTTMFAHTADVKGLCSTRENGGFVSVSRDLSAKLWHPVSESSNQYVQAQVITTHKKYVNSVVVVYTIDEYPNGLIVTGSNDQTIAFHDIESNKVIAQFAAHDGPVCTMNFDNNSKINLLYSGSFDCTAKVWNLNDLVRNDFKLSPSITIKGHDLTVWNVLGIDSEGILLTASADKSIKHWLIKPSTRSAECLLKYTGHTDCVRGLSLNNLNRQEFFSCSNDGNVLQWRLGHSSPLRTINVTDSFLYSINMLCNHNESDCHFITSSEDRSLRIHSVVKSQIQLVQTIVLPCQTLWNSICLPNGNIVVACSDGSLRLFTQNEALMAPKTEQEEYEKELSQFAIPVKTNQQMSQINLNKLPGVEALLTPGRNDGQNLIINNENEAEVYQWDSTESRWVKIGVAVGSSESGGGSRQKVHYMGKEYDYVFDIELDDEGTKLKLPYNLTEDPYHAAQKFIHTHELNQHFLDQIAQFLIKNTESQVIGSTNQANSNYDPFTGGNSYVPSSYESSQSSNYGTGDPFTGTNAYMTGSTNGQFKGKSTPKLEESNEYYPHLNYLLFDQYNLEPIIKKLRDLQKEIAPSHKNELISNPNYIDMIEDLMKKKFSRQDSAKLDTLFQMIDCWPEDKVFPLLDLVRVLILDREVCDCIFENQSTSLLTSKQTEPTTNHYFLCLFKFISEQNLVNSMLVIRIVINIFNSLNNLKSSEKLLSFVLNERTFLLNRLIVLSGNSNKAFQISYSTLLLNYTILYHKLVNFNSTFNSSYCSDLLLELIEYLNDSTLTNNFINWDSEALFRLLVTMGTLVTKKSSGDIDNEYVLTVAKSLQNSKLMCQEIKSKSLKYADKVTKCSEYLLKLLS